MTDIFNPRALGNFHFEPGPTMLPSGQIPNLPGSGGAPIGAPWGGTSQNVAGGSVMSGMLGNQNPLADLGSILGGFSQGEKADRVVKGNFTQNYDQMMADQEQRRNQTGQTALSNYNKESLDAQQGRARNEADALSKLHSTSYTLGKTQDYKPATVMNGGHAIQLPDFGIGPKASSQAEIDGANALQSQLVNRLGPNGSFTPEKFNPNFNFTPHNLDDYAKPGTAEKLGSYGGAALSGLGALGLGTGGGGGILGGLLGHSGGAASGGAGSAIGGILGKAAPIAGAVTGGLGLIHDHGVGQNMMNGLTAGASIGSMVPGLGTAVGAGIGAAVGGLRSLGSIGKPSAEELAGRGVSGDARQQLTANATPQQRAEAASSGWANPNDALGLITIRDMLIKNGTPPQQADQQAQGLFGAIQHNEKQGPQAVQQALSNVQNAVGHHG
jgi:hypothetical protein